ncbi:MAG TPA: hypothetical protein VK038_07330 [Ornithinicoccus sp.]|jgi:hypothetical protein|nr:hypothetical protein [Ornithinicoccus sp.]
MTSDPRAALAAFVAALENHLELAAMRRGENDPAVVAAYQRVADAFVAYDDALLDAYGEVTPLDIYTEDDEEDLEDLEDELDDLDEDADLDEEDELDEDDEDDDLDDEDEDLEDYDDEEDDDTADDDLDDVEGASYRGLDDEEYDLEDVDRDTRG